MKSLKIFVFVSFLTIATVTDIAMAAITKVVGQPVSLNYGSASVVSCDPISDPAGYPFMQPAPNTVGVYGLTAGGSNAATGAFPFTLTCQSAAGANISSSDTLNVTPAVTTFPDLVAGALSPSTATVGTPFTFTATISNIGTASTGASFNNVIQYIDGTGATFYSGLMGMPALAAGASNTMKYPFTPSGPGTFPIRACADSDGGVTANGKITESNENNNCGPWTSITFSCPTGTSWNGTACATTTSSFLNIFFN